MMVVILQDAPAHLRSQLSLRLLEIRSGVYVSTCVGTDMRDMMRRHVVDNIGSGRAVLAHQDVAVSPTQSIHISNGSRIGTTLERGIECPMADRYTDGRFATSACLRDRP